MVLAVEVVDSRIGKFRDPLLPLKSFALTCTFSLAVDGVAAYGFTTFLDPLDALFVLRVAPPANESACSHLLPRHPTNFEPEILIDNLSLHGLTERVVHVLIYVEY